MFNNSPQEVLLYILYQTQAKGGQTPNRGYIRDVVFKFINIYVHDILGEFDQFVAQFKMILMCSHILIKTI